jgi:hypothetical protein
MKTDANRRKNFSPISVSIFLADTGWGLGKTELKIDRDIRKYRNRHTNANLQLIVTELIGQPQFRLLLA